MISMLRARASPRWCGSRERCLCHRAALPTLAAKPASLCKSIYKNIYVYVCMYVCYVMLCPQAYLCGCKRTVYVYLCMQYMQVNLRVCTICMYVCHV